MIISTHLVLKVGSIHEYSTLGCLLSDDTGKYHTEFKFLVLREATKHEWITENENYPNLIDTLAYNQPYFYEVSMD